MVSSPNDILLNQIKPGMIVNDAMGQEIGRVNYVQLGQSATDINPPNEADAPMHHPSYTHNIAVTDIPNTLQSAGGLPEDLREAIAESGYIRMSTGGLTADRFILPRQIENVYRRRVELNCKRDDLLKA